MMQLVCNRHKLDLYENTELQFTEDNPLFAFDRIKCERTTNFKLPATPANDRVFALARIPAYAGEGMRRKFPVQLQMGTIVKDGYLYVSSWSGKEYEAIFVTGEMVGLQVIKDSGKIAEYYRPNNTLVWDVSQIKDANTAAGQSIWALTRYLCGNANLILPSADLADIISNAYFAVTQRRLIGLQRGWRLVPNELKGIPTSSLEVHFEGTGNTPSTSETSPADANRMSTTLAPLVRFMNTTLVVYDGQLNDRFWRVQQLVAGQTLRLTFPADFSSDYFLVGIRDLGTQGTDPLYFPFSTEWFLGGYYFSPNLNTNTNVTYGTPLAGKTVEIPAGTPFVFVKKNWITWRPNTQGSAGVIYGFTQLADVGNVYTLTIQADGNDIASGNVVRLADNLPELTLIELLKIYAYLTGTQLYYNGQDIEFDDLFFISWKRFDISKQLLSIGKVTRTFADYAQRNIVGFDSADDVLYSQRITAEYDINNDNIDTNKEIGKIPYSEGQIGIANNEQVAQFDMEESYGKKMQKSGIMEARGIAPEGNTYGIRVVLPTNAGIQALCDASTQVEVQARMSAYEYAQINAKTRIFCRGTEYVWTSRSWQKDTAKFVLAKLPPLDYYGLTAEARAEIEQAFGFDVLVQVYRYVAERPAIVPFINEDPHLVCSLVETDYERLLQHGEGAYIDTEYKVTQDPVFELRMRRNDYEDMNFIGNSTLNGVGTAKFGAAGSSFGFYGRYGSTSYYQVYRPYSAGVKYNLILGKQVYVDGVLQYTFSTNYAYNPNQPSVCIFRSPDYNIPTRALSFEFAYVKISNGGELALDLIPCVHNGENGFLDIISMQFIGSSGAKTFTIVEELK